MSSLVEIAQESWSYILTGFASLTVGAFGTWVTLSGKIAKLKKDLAETKKILGEVELQKLQSATAHIAIQEKLQKENEKYKSAVDKFSDGINALAKMCGKKTRADGSDLRNNAIKDMSDAVYAFNGYIEKAKEYYKHESSFVIKTTIQSEIIPFFSFLVEGIAALNSPNVVAICKFSITPLAMSDSSLGGVKIALHQFMEKLDEPSRDGRRPESS